MSDWQAIETAKKEIGAKVWLWCVHNLAQYCEDPVAEGYAAPVVGEWIDHNGGGWTWHGLCGVHTHWMPYRDGDPLPSPPS